MRREWKKEGEREKIKSFNEQLDEADFFPPLKRFNVQQKRFRHKNLYLFTVVQSEIGSRLQD